MVRLLPTPWAALLVAFAAVLEVAVAPYLTLGYAAPRFMIIGIVFAAAGLRDLQGILVGFFGGVLTDALGGGLFGTHALAGLVAAFLAVRSGVGFRKYNTRLTLVFVVMLAVAAFDIIGITALNLSGYGSVPVGRFMVVGVMPDVLLNGLLAYLFCRVMERFGLIG
ncbi:rod shape-determining protein MreD [Rubrobacter taiwanensis]|uniref:Rod shape-determining protein MreD n=1 Tax=Rubrobacter taiwanensis TaxID=185139 RepID=A0A4R1BJ71_9ACTN|nr:rod shape-determining protein MreD [Rubrobacter taiwanensis]